MAAEKISSADLEKTGSEQWKDITGYEGWYQISNHGRVRSVDRIGCQRHWRGGQSKYLYKGQIRIPYKRKNGYVCITLRKDGVNKTFNIHRLVALHFLPRVEGKEYVNHLDANPDNNHVSNLVWCTQSENIKYAYDNGTKKPPHEKKISQFDMDGNLIKVWKSQAEIERTLGIYQANIHKVCRGKRKMAGGFKWEYAEQ